MIVHPEKWSDHALAELIRQQAKNSSFGHVRIEPTRMVIYTHGDNEVCPNVLSGEWPRCMGHAQEW